MNVSFEIVLAIFIGIGVLGAIGFGLYQKYNMNYVPNPVETTGEIMEIETREIQDTNPINRLFGGGDSDGNVYYHPVIRFRVEGQKMVRFRNRKGFKDATTYKKGDQVKVVFNKNNPLIAKLLED